MEDYSCAVRWDRVECNNNGICQGPRGCYCDDDWKGAFCDTAVVKTGAGGQKGAFEFGSSIGFEDLNLPIILALAGFCLCCLLFCVVYWFRWCRQMRQSRDPLVYDEEENKYRGTIDIAKLYLMRSKTKLGMKRSTQLEDNPNSTFKAVDEKDYSGRCEGAAGARSEVQPFKCSECGKAYDTMQLLSNHQQLRHPDLKDFTFECVECGKGYDTMQLLNNHRQLRHGAKPESIVGTKAKAGNVAAKPSSNGATTVSRCAECGKAYDSKELLERHIKLRHTDDNGPKPFACDEYKCESKYATEDQLKRHRYLRHEGGLEIEREKKRKAVARKSSALALQGHAPHLHDNKRMSVAVTASERASVRDNGVDEDDADSLDEFLPIVPIGFVAAEKQDVETGQSLRKSLQISGAGDASAAGYDNNRGATRHSAQLSAVESGAEDDDGDEDDEMPPPMPPTLHLEDVDSKYDSD